MRDIGPGGRLDGQLVNAQPEYNDVVRAARFLDRRVVDVIVEARAAARTKSVK